MPARSSILVAAAVLVAAYLLLGLCARAAPEGAEVAEFPGFGGELPSKHYAGYIAVGQQQQKRHIYYYFATSERDPALDPVVVWINGGPACSGFSAFIHSIAPFKIEASQIHHKDDARVIKNPYSWTKMASLLLVDSPAGVGYSYADNEDDYVTNDTSRVVDLYDFLSKGYSLCNPAIDVDVENNALVPYAFRMGLISDELFQWRSFLACSVFFDLRMAAKIEVQGT
ncbi:hypothetical protein PR202_gb08462 [Eleusine coracana subsp. coracana]|uniref:Uncharacterized protein n=1 Tax=Eleusine coracana subsp. coracana TaxID=191504 RepID=A0AAV5EE05_ELECO|nr:hypothetical protein PR202_gb08462 [Eleusine coracana subsp. coracana]